MRPLSRLAIVSLVAGSVAAPALADDFLVIANGNSLGKGFATKVEKAGGTVTRTIDEAGVARVRAADAGFAAGLKGVTVLPDVRVRMIPPTEEFAVTAEQAEAAAANPPASGDDDFFFDLQWGNDAVDAPEAWAAGQRGQGVRVAVLDGGFDTDHPDLAPNINYGLSTNFVAGETLEYALPDAFSHGTHVAGTIAAADNGYGTIGIAPEAELVLVKVLGDDGEGSFADVISGIVYAGSIHADVINMSLGASIPQGLGVDASGVAALRTAMNRAVNYASQQGATVIVAAGNDASDLDKDKSTVVFPADMPHALSISATGPTNWALDPATSLDGRAIYTNYGRSGIDFAAPGGDYHSLATPEGTGVCTVAGVTNYCYVFDFVFSTGSQGAWYWSVGTSMAAPHASGVAALIIGEHGGSMQPARVRAELQKRADDLGQPGNDPTYGAGRVSSGY